MKGFDLYRIALAYLCVIFAMCAVVVFQPQRWIWPLASPADLRPTAEPIKPSDPVAPRPPTLVAAAPVVATSADGAADAETTGRGDVPALDDETDGTAEEVARIVAAARDAVAVEDVGEGDASAPSDLLQSPVAALVASGADATYTVDVGDSLGSIALRFYGDSALFEVIFDANRGLMGSPDRLRVGQVLIIPGRS